GVFLLAEMVFPAKVVLRPAVHSRGSARNGKPASIEIPIELFVILLSVTLTVILDSLCVAGIRGIIAMSRIPKLEFGSLLLSLRSFSLIRAVTLSKVVPGATGRSDA